MVELDTDDPCFFWTFDDFEKLKNRREEEGFGASVWKRNEVISYAIGTTFVTFDEPEEWGQHPSTVRLDRSSEGWYQHRSEDISYEGVRADSATHVVLTGKWREKNYGSGVFIAVFPIKK